MYAQITHSFLRSPKPCPVVVDTLLPFNQKSNTDLKVTVPISESNEEKQEICYQFIHSNNYKQQTEPTTEYICPWCSLNCNQLYALLKHLKLSHDRFTFIYVAQPNVGYINVTVNELHDGSYTGSPYDSADQAGFTFSRIGPVRRTVVTHLLTFRPKRPKHSLSEFIEIDESELNSQRPFLIGHNR